MKKISLTLVTMLLMLSAFTANARGRGFDRFDRSERERIRIFFDDEHMRGQNVIPLKRMIRQQEGRIDFQDYDLVKVRLVAKTRKGHGTAKLVVGQSESMAKTVGGSPQDFHDYGYYDRVVMRNPKSNSNGKWQVHLKGNFKIDKVVVVMEKKQRSRMLNLAFDGQQMRGQNTLFLKREIKQKYPNLDLSQYDLISATLSAKSKHGRGQASLVVGQNETYSETVYGDPSYFQTNRSRSYDEIEFDNYFNSSRGKWQIKLRGNIKVEYVQVLIIKK